MPRTGRGQGARRQKDDGPHPIDVKVGARVRLQRNLLGLSQERLGEALGLTFQQVQKYERGANRISASRLWEMGQVLGVSISFLYDIEQAGEQLTEEPGESSPLAHGFAEAAAPFEARAPSEADPLRRRETVDLVNAFYDLPDPALRRRFLELARTLAASLPPADKE